MIHPLADCKNSNIPDSTNIWQFCVIFKGCIIGENCNVCTNVLIEDDVKIGNNVTIKSGVQLWNGVELEDNVFIGPNVTFTNDIYPRSKQYLEKFERTLVKKGASIGANATIIAGHVIGQFALVGAGSIITKNVPNNTVWYGNPAKQKGFITRKGVVLDMNKRDVNGKIHEI